jgi:protein gp37
MVKCPDNIHELEELEKLLPLCRKTLYEQAQARLDAGTATSERGVAKQLGEEIGKSPETVRKAIRREKKERLGTVSPPKSQFNKTNEMVGWASWTWNPYTGCEHGCKYCYARDIANRFYKEKFKPTFRPHRLNDPENTPVPNEQGWNRRVFVCSMADLFGEWVEQDHIDKILQAAGEATQWTFIYLTKNPERLLTIKWPENSWVGATVDSQERAHRTEPVFSKLNVPFKFYSVEPFVEPIRFRSLELVDLIIIGGRSRSSQMPAKYPGAGDLARLLLQIDMARTRYWIKGNVNNMRF